MTVPSREMFYETVSYGPPLTASCRWAITTVKLPDIAAAAGTAAT
jgi:hypothetical protein